MKYEKLINTICQELTIEELEECLELLDKKIKVLKSWQMTKYRNNPFILEYFNKKRNKTITFEMDNEGNLHTKGNVIKEVKEIWGL